MTEDTQTVNDADLHAYVDGELDEGRRLDIEAYLANGFTPIIFNDIEDTIGIVEFAVQPVSVFGFGYRIGGK